VNHYPAVAAKIGPEADVRNRGYEEAFELVMGRYRNRVFRLGIPMLRDTAQAEEAAQDAFRKLRRALPDYNGRASLSTWLYAIARNTLLSALRSNKYHRSEPIDGNRSYAEPTIPRVMGRNVHWRAWTDFAPRP
jgi:RNA polymerase sigma-70 factor (ECF subfamily)